MFVHFVTLLLGWVYYIINCPVMPCRVARIESTSFFTARPGATGQCDCSEPSLIPTSIFSLLHLSISSLFLP